MRDIRIKTKAGKAPAGEALPLPFVTLLLLLAGIFGILLFLQSPSGVAFSGWVVYPVAAGMCWALWFSYGRSRWAHYTIVFVAMGICALWMLFQWEELWEQLVYVVRSMQRELRETQVTQLAVLFTVLLSLVLFAAECVLKSHAVVYLLTTALLLVTPLLGFSVGLPTIFLLLLFQLAFWALRVAARRGGSVSNPSARARQAGKSAIAFGLILALLFLASLPLGYQLEEPLYESAYAAEGFVRSNVRKLMHKPGKPVEGGKINAGNNYQTGVENLYLTSYGLPSETMYLRGFSGGDYLGGDWTAADDGKLFAEMTQGMSVRYTIDNMYYYLNDSFTASSIMDGSASMKISSFLRVQHANPAYETVYLPYYSTLDSILLPGDVPITSTWESSGVEGAQESMWSVENTEYTCFYYEQKDVEINWDEMSIMDHFIATRYMELIRDVYTQAPAELLPRLTALVEGTPLTELDEITAFILYTLHSNTKYTLSPGWSSPSQDIAEYFLFERKKGYCQHYALTATLMYRLYGIPARYATGYLVSPEDFTLQVDGSYQAVVTDKSAHAWVEIFLEEYGWTPVEVTPASDGSTIAAYPGFDAQRLQQIWRAHGWNVRMPSLLGNRDNAAAGPGAAGSRLPAAVRIVLFLLPAVCIVALIALSPLFFKKRRAQLLKKQENASCRVVYYRLLRALHFGGLLPDCTGEEAEFAARLAACVPAVTCEETEKLVAVVSQAAFGPFPPDEEANAFARALYGRVASAVYAGLPRRKKLIFKWIRVYG